MPFSVRLSRAIAVAFWLASSWCVLAQSSLEIPRFVDARKEAGIEFSSVSGSRLEKRYLFEAKGGGSGFFDFDNDGWMDLLLVQGTSVEGFRKREPLRAALYRNKGDGTFEDVSERANLSYVGWGMGVTFGDYNNDGWVDVYLTNLVANSLYRNNGDGIFTDVTLEAAVGDPRWSSSAAFGDYDSDGDLDLYVCNYIAIDPDNPPEPGSLPTCHYRGRLGICGPLGLTGAPNTLYRNNGDGTFADVSRSSGADTTTPYFSLSAVWADIDNDFDLDLFVGNDSTPNGMLINQGDGTFQEMGLLTGLAASTDGRFQASMGIDVADYDNDGLLDVVATHFANDYTTLYHNLSGSLFEDVSHQAQLVQPEWLLVSWGARFVDLNHDGWKDIFHSNGHIYPYLLTAGWDEKYYQPSSLYLNRHDGTFLDAGKEAGGDIQRQILGRGVSFADYDNDGDIDFAVTNLDAEPLLLRNDLESKSHWVMFRTVGTRSNRDGIGARITLRAGGLRQVWEIKTAVSIYSASDPRAHFGLGAAAVVDSVQVRWPSGETQEFNQVPADVHYVIEEGKGLAKEGM